mmetsp:Transcript_6302/g.20150  ORF Transcript_6302/g.20150 Transcript_6302/m.20150 type:complete len:141 (+) Transcript_6302:34-456(+)
MATSGSISDEEWDEVDDQQGAGWQDRFEEIGRADSERRQQSEEKRIREREMRRRVRFESPERFALIIIVRNEPHRFSDSPSSPTVSYRWDGQAFEAEVESDGGVTYRGVHYATVAAWISHCLSRNASLPRGWKLSFVSSG